MTLQEAIDDKSRPLSVSPKEWMEYEQSAEQADADLTKNAARRIVAEEQGIPEEKSGEIEVTSEECVEIGIEQMILGCRMVLRGLQELSRQNLAIDERRYYDDMEQLMRNEVLPDVADLLINRKKYVSARIGLPKKRS